MFCFYSKPNDVRATIVAKLENGLMTFAASRCTEDDQFVKKIGRELAEKRLTSGNILFAVPIPASIEKPGKEFVRLAQKISKSVILDKGLTSGLVG
jgi:hypothetical protein